MKKEQSIGILILLLTAIAYIYFRQPKPQKPQPQFEDHLGKWIKQKVAEDRDTVIQLQKQIKSNKQQIAEIEIKITDAALQLSK